MSARLLSALVVLGLVAACDAGLPAEVWPVEPTTALGRAQAQPEVDQRAFRRALDPQVLPNPNTRPAAPDDSPGGGGRARDRQRLEAGAALLESLESNPRAAAELVQAMMSAMREGPEDDPCGRLFAAASVLNDAGDFELGEREFRRSCEAHPPELRACLLGEGQLTEEQRRTCERIAPGFPTFGGFLPGPTRGEADFEATAAQRAARREARSGPPAGFEDDEVER